MARDQIRKATTPIASAASAALTLGIGLKNTKHHPPSANKAGNG